MSKASLLLLCAVVAGVLATKQGQWTWRGTYETSMTGKIDLVFSEKFPDGGRYVFELFAGGQMASKTTGSCASGKRTEKDPGGCRSFDEPCVDGDLPFSSGAFLEGMDGASMSKHTDIHKDSDEKEACPNGDGMCTRYIMTKHDDEALTAYLWMCDEGNVHALVFCTKDVKEVCSVCSKGTERHLDSCTYMMMSKLEKTPLPDSDFVLDC